VAPSEVEAAEAAAAVFSRLVAEGGVLDQIIEGTFEFADDRHRRDVAELLSAAAEAARAARELAGGAEDVYLRPAAAAVKQLADMLLPFNRKERFFTGTVLPMIIASDGFAHLHRFLGLCGLAGVEVDAGREPHQPNIQFLTEYGFGESLVGEAKVRFADAPTGRDTPDVVLAGADWLLAVEAKLYDRPSKAALSAQLQAQQVLVDYWADKFEIPNGRCRHVALLPQGLAAEVGEGLAAPVVTWEAVLGAYRRVGPSYWVGVLGAALDAYPALVSQSFGFEKNSDALRTGAQIVDDPGPFTCMGRAGGLDGAGVATDLATGGWRTRTYEVRYEPLPNNGNWFPISEFILRVKAQARAGAHGWGTAAGSAHD
jgi:hypothetical protein